MSDAWRNAPAESQPWRTAPAVQPEDIDKSRGAPSQVRAVVGAAEGPDRLNNLQRYYPDAAPYGEDNFVFTDPETGQRTLYNPEGFDVGDLFSVGREITEAVYSAGGATLGGAGGFVIGAPTGPGAIATTATGTTVGAGAGAAIGGQLFDIAMELAFDPIDTRTMPQRLTGAGLDFTAGAVGQRVGDLVGIGFKRALGGGTTAAKELAKRFKALGVTPPAAAASQGRVTQTVSKGLESSPASADILQQQAETVLGQIKTAADNLASEYGQARTAQGAGEAIRNAAKAAAERFGLRQSEAYERAFDLVGADSRVTLAAAKALEEGMEAELARAPQSLRGALLPAIELLKRIQADAGEEGLSFSALRQVRTMVGKDLDTPLLIGSSGAQNEAMKRVYAALTLDMSDAAKAAGPEAAKTLAVADRYTRAFMATASKTLEKINRFDADEKAFRFALQSARDGGTALTRLRRHFQPEEWDTVAATVLARMGRATPGAQDAAGDVFSVSTFLTNWNRLAPEAKQALFGGNRYKDLAPQLDKLVAVSSSLKDVERLANTSNTARAMITFSTIQALAGGLTGSALGDGPESFAAGAIGFVVAPRVAAKLITNPRFVEWLVTPVSQPNAISSHVGRLTAIMAAEPEIAGEIQQFMEAMREIPADSDAPAPEPIDPPTKDAP